jgi:hypothetical protein
MMSLDFATYVRKPFTIEAIEITKDNIAEIAELVGTLQYKKNGAPYIKVNRLLFPNFIQIFPGFWITRMSDGSNLRCFSKRIFHNQFIANSPDIEPWLEYMGDNSNTEMEEEKPTNENEMAEDRVNIPLFSGENE